jgi:16S rRNA (guanine527-N7)-methyltransferase
LTGYFSNFAWVNRSKTIGPTGPTKKSFDFADLILEFTGKTGIAIAEEQALLLSRHVEIMLEWNSRLNLTRITAPEDIIVKHLLDSILPSRFLPLSGHALDVGTGAGFPGIPLKIVYPGLSMVLLDSNRKKVSFLTAVATTLGLKGVQAQHGRWQDFYRDAEHANQFELITMRALRLEPEHITSLASRVLAPGGVLAHWTTAGGGESEEHAARNGNFLDERRDSGADGAYSPCMEYGGDFSYLLPGIDQPRAVRLWRKTKSFNFLAPFDSSGLAV